MSDERPGFNCAYNRTHTQSFEKVTAREKVRSAHAIFKQPTMLLALAPVIVSLMLLAGSAQPVAAQSPQFVPAFPLYCAGPLITGAASGGETTTPFQWASVGAGVANPAPGQCVWADRAPRGSEILAGGGNVICDFSSAMKSVATGTFIEIGVARDPLVNNCLHLARYLGPASPPFSGVPALPPFVRPSIASLSPVQIASLQRGISVMMTRAVTDPTSYRFQADVHGTTDNPTTAAQMQSWNQCEHGSFYFLSWHRMYLYFFDRILRAAAGDPNLVLPYWDWTDPAQRTLPLAFRQPADSSNPLFIASPGRPAALNAGTASLSADTVDDSGAFADTSFETGGNSGNGFGGETTTPMQFARAYGDLEMQPHNVVHSALGGLMGDPITAGQDPIFWLHHANIDRLWNRWIQQGGRADPVDSAWLNTTFTFYDEAGHAVYLTGSEIVNSVGQLNYRYDDDPLPPSSHIVHGGIRREQEVLPPTQIAQGVPASGETRIKLAGTPVRVQVPLTEAARTSLRLLVRGTSRKLFLRIDDVRTQKPPSFYYAIYLDPPAGQRLDSHAPGFVANFSLFSLLAHSSLGGKPMAMGDVFLDFDITRFVSPVLDRNPNEISVILVPRGLVGAGGEQLPVASETAGTFGSVRLIER
jgi:hypothetical protein